MKDYERYIDFIIDAEAGSEVRVLQLTDTQIIDASQRRYESRLNEKERAFWAKENMEERVFRHSREAVALAKPHLIILTGDLVYGEFDDKGTSFKAFVEHMDSYRIPWAPIYGNHDNESRMGAVWQNQQLVAAKYCLFRKGDTDGNGNYTVGIRQGEEIIRIFYMLDSNACAGAYGAAENGVSTAHGFTENQLKWLYGKMEQFKTSYGGKSLSASLCWHVPTNEFVLANNQYYQQKKTFTIDIDIVGINGDFGSLKETNGIKSPFTVMDLDGRNFLEQLKKHGVDSVFVGHSHCVNTSILYEGIRWTFGLKTGEYDRYTEGETGGTLITLDGATLSVRHLYIS